MSDALVNDDGSESRSVNAWTTIEHGYAVAVAVLERLNARIEAVLGRDFLLGHSVMWHVSGGDLTEVLRSIAYALDTQVTGTLQLSFVDNDAALRRRPERTNRSGGHGADQFSSVLASAAGQYRRSCASEVTNQTIRPAHRCRGRGPSRSTPRMKRVPAVEEAPLDVDPVEVIGMTSVWSGCGRSLLHDLSLVSGAPRAPVVHNLVESVQVSANLVVDVLEDCPEHGLADGHNRSTGCRPHPRWWIHTARSSRCRDRFPTRSPTFCRPARACLRNRGAAARNSSRAVAATVALWAVGCHRLGAQSTACSSHLPLITNAPLTADNEFTRALARVALALAA